MFNKGGVVDLVESASPVCPRNFPVHETSLFGRTAGLGGSASKFTTVLGATSRAAFGRAEIAGGATGQALRGLTGTARVGGALGRLANDAMPGLALTDLVATAACHF